MPKRLNSCAFAAALSLATASAQAAGGHFDVDDAAVLEPGHCQYETWASRAPSAHASAFHLGPACRVGPVEVGANIDHATRPGEHRSMLGPQLKIVADPVVNRLSTGLAWSTSFDLAHGGKPWQTLYMPATWWAANKLWLHANVGADWSPSGTATQRVGASAEWATSDQLSFIAEHIRCFDTNTSRIGARFTLNASISIDVSAARSGPNASRLYTFGLNHDFKR